MKSKQIKYVYAVWLHKTFYVTYASFVFSSSSSFALIGRSAYTRCTQHYAFAGWQWFDFVIIICINRATWGDLHAAHFNGVFVTCVCVRYAFQKQQHKQKNKDLYYFTFFASHTTNNLQRFFPTDLFFHLAYERKKPTVCSIYVLLSHLFAKQNITDAFFVAFSPHSKARSARCENEQKKCTTTWECVSLFFISNCMRCTIRYYYHPLNFHLYVRVLY